MQEDWKNVAGYESSYEISSLGNLRSLNKRVKSRFGFRIIKGKALKISVDNKGYSYILLCDKQKYKMFRIHQLVAVAFLGHTINGFKAVINHKDFDRSNNRKDNLEITSQRKNANQKHLPSTSEYTGVYWKSRDKRWISVIVLNGKQIHLGSYLNEIDAHEAYQERLKQIEKC